MIFWSSMICPNLGSHMWGLPKVQQRGVPACKEILAAILDGAMDTGKVYKIFVIDALPSKLLLPILG